MSPVSIVSMLSRSNASPKAGSLATRFCTSSLKLFVNAISTSCTALPRLSFRRPSELVARPMLLRVGDIARLALLGAARQQDHQHIPVPPEIYPIARPPIDP